MSAEILSPVSQQNLAGQARRLLKTWQEVDLVRRMDTIIINSRGAYADRSEFLAEALRDRIEAEEQRLADEVGKEEDSPRTPAASTPIAASGAHTPHAGSESTMSPLPPDIDFCDWLEGETPTLPLAPGPATNFGLHNRDWPTLLAADWLGRLTSNSGKPLEWSHFTRAVTDWAWEYAAKLQREDLDRPRGAKVAAGFPTNRKKPEATEMRFREHFLGMSNKRGNHGPLFVFRLIGVDDRSVALSEPGIALLDALHAAGAATGPPFSVTAWRAFARHLREHSPQELDNWLRVLAIVAEGPDRETLVNRCNWWKGGAADTNSMSLIARGREWGLVELALDEGRYQLTNAGTNALQAEWEQGAVPV
ncbi:MAG TPA: ribbon-helix-helix domain-containing protein [Solirubrobacterales bacterium]|nr:ribbon-helix-helix domain-containing protein [Solirubrobacterales bacterium]